ncbi:peptidylprolyl isomerase [Thalassotalea sediminis]|uniref:peptidylprolyl isomerase n=1 Tax=Thalassotalea sediminis TaxID=1759089 RepID=UPI0025727BBE|nr:peptidylprolyl isomerase [Thalassotalea sediminis]
MLKTILTLITLLTLTPCIAAESSDNWRKVSSENIVVIALPQGNVFLELAPTFAPKHVARFKQLVRDGFYDNEHFYRVIDGFVAQAGPKDGSAKDKKVPPLLIEEEIITPENWSFTLVQNKDMFAPQTGFKQGFSVGYSAKENKAWLLHCPGVIAMARESAPNTGTSHFYITIGQATRYLDRIMTIFGRVILGMEHVQAIKRTAVSEGQPEVDSAQYTQIKSVNIMADLPKEEQFTILVENTDNALYAKKITQKRLRDNPFFYKKQPPILDICQSTIKTKVM